VKLLADVNVAGGVVERPRDLGWIVERAVDHVPANSTDEVVLAWQPDSGPCS
jgi:hypothetical protein